MACIYKIENLVNGKFYIGSTQRKNSNLRKIEHFSRLDSNSHNNKHLQKSWNKHGKENFVFKIIEQLEFPIEYEIIMEKELKYIKTLSPAYNIKIETTGGKLGMSVSSEHKERLKKLFSGRKRSPETINKIKLARNNQIITEEHKIKISNSLKGNTNCLGHNQSKKQKENLSNLIKDCSINKTGIHSIESKNKRAQTIKLIFNTPEMKEKFRNSARQRLAKPFQCFKKGVLIKEFSNHIEASEFLGFKKSWGISAVLNGTQNTHKGYTFNYKNIYNG